ncbi:MAG: DUF1801 domain-containing protein [Microgenomates group bacterium]
MNPEIQSYNNALNPNEKEICDLLMKVIDAELTFTESKIWHAHPVWFINGNPIVGYSMLKDGVRMMFWSGADFDEVELLPGSGKFKDASIKFTSKEQINVSDIKRYLDKSMKIQWDYKNIVKRKGKLIRIP